MTEEKKTPAVPLPDAALKDAAGGAALKAPLLKLVPLPSIDPLQIDFQMEVREPETK